MIRLNGKYKTHNGLKVRILCVDRNSTTFPVVGLQEVNDETPDLVRTYTLDGIVCHGFGTKLNLVEIENETIT